MIAGEIVLGEEHFPHFAPLMAAAHAHALRTGFRFKSPCSQAPSSQHDAADALFQGVSSFWREKLRAADEAVAKGEATEEQMSLMAEVRKACDVVMAESVRSAMIGTCKELELFPPPPMPKGYGVEEEDCAYEDCTAPLPVIAQRLYNDSEQRLLYGECEGRAQQKTLLLTAFFITEFVEDAGIAAPPLALTARSMLSDFATAVAEWTNGSKHGNGACDLWERVQAAFADGLAAVAEGIVLVRDFLLALFNEACNIFAACKGRVAGAVAKAKVTAADMRRSTERFASIAQSKASQLRARANRCATNTTNDLYWKCATKRQGYSMTSLPRLLGTAVVSSVSSKKQP